jgi:hypothetical protein
MRTNPDPEREDALLDATLCDETWQAANAAFKAEALRTFRVRQRIRQLSRGVGSVAALAMVIAGVVHWFARPTPARRQMTVALTQAPKAPDKPRHLTDQDLVAAFPKGSCFIAEVDGRKELVFFDPEIERTYVARTDVRGD